MPIARTLCRFERIGWELWLTPAVAASVWGPLVAGAGGDLVAARTLVFAGGPVVLMAGMFDRLGAFLHAPGRWERLPLPLHPDLHFGAAQRPHRVGLLATAATGSVAVGVAVVTGLIPAGVPGPSAALLLADWIWLVLLAALCEPAVAGAAAWLGRRFDPESSARRLQLQAGGGWTLPEAVVHLYAPALGVAVAALLALPGQLSLDRWADAQGASPGAAPPPAMLATMFGPLVVAVALRLWARRAYATGMFEAVAWLHQATRTLAGPPIPEPAPRWIGWLRDPSLRLWALQLWRVTPVPGLRLWALLGTGAWIGWTASLGLAPLAVLAGLVALWVVPAARLPKLRDGRGAFLCAMPIHARGRGGACRAAGLLLAAPVVVAIALAAGGTAAQAPPSKHTLQSPEPQ